MRYEIQRATLRSGVDEWQDVWMREARGDLDLAQETIGTERTPRAPAASHLQRDVAIVFHVTRQIHGRHAAASELANDFQKPLNRWGGCRRQRRDRTRGRRMRVPARSSNETDELCRLGVPGCASNSRARRAAKSS
jgi:hypothetical protein